MYLSVRLPDFARTDYDGPAMTNLTKIINYVKPTALLGLSTIRGAFTEEAVKAMASLNERPIIFPLSNPISLCELEFSDAIQWSAIGLRGYFDILNFGTF
jgi:malate dehydrogenase (oxaloacetate-decarboxylating)(NADP+)